MTKEKIEEIRQVAHFNFDDGVRAFCTDQPREVPQQLQGIWRDLWLFGWDVAEAMATIGSKEWKNQRECDDEIRRMNRTWRRRRPLFAVIDGGKTPASRGPDAKPGDF